MIKYLLNRVKFSVHCLWAVGQAPFWPLFPKFVGGRGSHEIAGTLLDRYEGTTISMFKARPPKIQVYRVEAFIDR